MSINPGSDIILDVMRAADPTRAELATQRLEALGRDASTDPAEFSAVLAHAGELYGTSGATPSSADLRTKLAALTKSKKDSAHAVETAFEASILTSFVKEMLPKDSSAVFGQGTAGDIWKSMLAQQVAGELARSGRLDIAKELFATHQLPHPGDASSTTDRVTNSAPKAVQASANPLSMSPTLDLSAGSSLFKTRI